MVLAYSGGLDTSVILKWLQETYDCEVVTFTADLGQVGRLLIGLTTADALHSCWQHIVDMGKAQQLIDALLVHTMMLKHLLV